MNKTALAIAGVGLGAALGAIAVLIVVECPVSNALKDTRMPVMVADGDPNVRIEFLRMVPQAERPEVPIKYRGEFLVTNHSPRNLTLFAAPGQDSTAPVIAAHINFAILVKNFWWESPKPIDLLPITVVIRPGESRTALVNLETVANVGTDYDCKLCIDNYWSEPFRLERLNPD